jgi:hypothetical protein
MAFKMKGFSGFKQSKADIINKYAAGVSEAFAGLGENFELKKKKKEEEKENEKKSTKKED